MPNTPKSVEVAPGVFKAPGRALSLAEATARSLSENAELLTRLAEHERREKDTMPNTPTPEQLDAARAHICDALHAVDIAETVAPQTFDYLSNARAAIRDALAILSGEAKSAEVQA